LCVNEVNAILTVRLYDDTLPKSLSRLKNSKSNVLKKIIRVTLVQVIRYIDSVC